MLPVTSGRQVAYQNLVSAFYDFLNRLCESEVSNFSPRLCPAKKKKIKKPVCKGDKAESTFGELDEQPYVSLLKIYLFQI